MNKPIITVGVGEQEFLTAHSIDTKFNTAAIIMSSDGSIDDLTMYMSIVNQHETQSINI